MKAEKQWDIIGKHHHHGIALPLSALHSQNSCGIGSFIDLIPMIQWCKSCGFDILQLLPLNDSAKDPSPYNAISAFALNPIYIDILSLPEIEKVPDYQVKIEELKKWNETPRVNYEQVRALKKALLEHYFQLVHAEVSQTPDYKKFVSENRWLDAYALFKSFKEEENWKTWEEWPLSKKSPSGKVAEGFLRDYNGRMQFHIFLQYLAFQQMEGVKKIATQEKVLLKGDIPILISRDSADVWAMRQLFLLNHRVGAPPDMYSKEGQDWGFPVYDWEAMGNEGYRWWKDRLRVASRFYDVYRLDHAVGFYRLWIIEKGQKAKEGHYMPDTMEKWLAQGQRLMEMMLESSEMLPIAEDLGSVPPEVKENLIDLGIPGTKMMRWERHWETDESYIDPANYPEMSMTTVSTHDSDTVKLWWRHFPKEAKLYCDFKGWNYRPFITQEQQLAILKDSHHSASLFHINQLMEYLALFPELVSSDPNAERINVPGKLLPTNWTYRFRPSVEQIVGNEKLKETMLAIKQS